MMKVDTIEQWLTGSYVRKRSKSQKSSSFLTPVTEQAMPSRTVVGELGGEHKCGSVAQKMNS